MAVARGFGGDPINDWPLRNNSFNEPIMPEDEKNERSFAVLGDTRQRTRRGWKRKESEENEEHASRENLVIE